MKGKRILALILVLVMLLPTGIVNAGASGLMDGNSEMEIKEEGNIPISDTLDIVSMQSDLTVTLQVYSNTAGELDTEQTTFSIDGGNTDNWSITDNVLNVKRDTPSGTFTINAVVSDYLVTKTINVLGTDEEPAEGPILLQSLGEDFIHVPPAIIGTDYSPISTITIAANYPNVHRIYMHTYMKTGAGLEPFGNLTLENIEENTWQPMSPLTSEDVEWMINYGVTEILYYFRIDKVKGDIDPIIYPSGADQNGYETAFKISLPGKNSAPIVTHTLPTVTSLDSIPATFTITGLQEGDVPLINVYHRSAINQHGLSIVKGFQQLNHEGGNVYTYDLADPEYAQMQAYAIEYFVYVMRNGGQAWFYYPDNVDPSRLTDLYAISIPEGLIVAPTPTLDTSELTNLINDMFNVYNNAVTGTMPGQYPLEAKFTFLDAIYSAVYIRDNATIQSELDNAVVNLNIAYQMFLGSAVQIPVVDRSALSALIGIANDLYYDSVEGTGVGQYPVGSRNTLWQALSVAEDVMYAAESSQLDVDSATNTLQAAVTAFENSRITEKSKLLGLEIVGGSEFVVDESDNIPLLIEGTVSNAVTQLEIFTMKNNDLDIVKIGGVDAEYPTVLDLQTGLNTFEITVQEEGKAVQTYTVKVTRQPQTRSVVLSIRDARTKQPLANATAIINGVSYVTNSIGKVTIQIFAGANDLEFFREGYIATRYDGFVIPSTWSGVVEELVRERVVDIIVKDKSTDESVASVSVVLNDTIYTTDQNGRVTVTIGELGNTISLSKPGYTSVTEAFDLSDDEEYVFLVEQTVDKSSLQAKFDEIELFCQSVDVGIEPGQYPEEAAVRFDLVLMETVNMLNENDAATQQEVDELLDLLIEEFEIFRNSVIPYSVSYDTDFTVYWGVANPLADATISINGSTLTTNDQGKATIQLPNGTYSYTISKTGWETQSGQIVVDGSEVSIEKTLLPASTVVVKYPVEFIVKTSTGVLPVSKVSINGYDLTVNEEGKAIINLQNGTYDYSVSKAGYVTQIGTIEVSGNAVSVTVTMVASPASGGGSTGGSGGGGRSSANTPQPTVAQPATKITDGLSTVETGQGTVKATSTEINKIMEQGKPVILESTVAKIDFGNKSLAVPEVKQGLSASLELGALLTEQKKTEEVLTGAKLQSYGLQPLGGKVLDLVAQLNYSDGTSKRIKSFAEPVKVTINLKELGLTGATNNMTAVRFVPQADGAYRTVKLGGTYNSKEETFEFYTDSFSLYSIVKTDKISKIKLTVDSNDYSVDEVNKLTDVAPIIKDNRTLVPIRIVAEALGAKVDWNQDLRLVTITLDGQVLELTIDQLIEDMDVPAKMIDNRTMVPIRYISEKLGAYVLWFGETKVVEIIK